MFNQLGLWLGLFLNGYVTRVVSDLSIELMPIVASLLTAYVALYGFAVGRGEASESVTVFFWKMTRQSAIMAFALAAGTYMDIVASTVTGLQSSLATLFISTNGTFGNVAPSTVFGALDLANNEANTLLKQIWQDASFYRLDLVIASILVSAGTVLFMFAGTIVAVIANTVATWVLCLGPLAITCLMFKQTAKFFDSWLSFLVSVVLVTTFVFFALGLSFYVVDQLTKTLTASKAFSVDGAVNAVEAAGTYLTFMAVLAYILLHAHEYASALAGGAAVQGGAGMLASMVGMRMAGVAGGAGAGGEGPAGSSGAGGSMQRGGGVPYAAGRAMGQAATAAGAAASAAYRRVAALAHRR